MSLPVIFLPVAEAEYRDAVDYYNAEVAGLGGDFCEEIIAALRRISDFPEAWQKVVGSHPPVPAESVPVWLGISSSG